MVPNRVRLQPGGSMTTRNGSRPATIEPAQNVEAEAVVQGPAER
jgi:hypothetical protein